MFSWDLSVRGDDGQAKYDSRKGIRVGRPEWSKGIDICHWDEREHWFISFQGGLKVIA